MGPISIVIPSMIKRRAEETGGRCLWLLGRDGGAFECHPDHTVGTWSLKSLPI